MSANNPVNWFEIPVTDLDRASAFYAAAFGSEFTPMEMGAAKMAMFPMEQGAPGAGGALVAPEGPCQARQRKTPPLPSKI